MRYLVCILAVLVFRVGIRLARFARMGESDAARAEHIRVSCEIAGFPLSVADTLIASGTTPHEAACLFRDALRRPSA